MIILSIISTIFIFINVFFLKNTFFGLFSIILWILSSGFFYQKLIQKWFNSIKFSFILGIFLSFFILSFFGSIFTVFYKINTIFFIISLLLTTALPLFFIKKEDFINIEKIKLKNFLDYSVVKFFNNNLAILLIGVFLFSGLIIYYLFQASSGEYNIYPFKNVFNYIGVIYIGLISLILIFIFKFKPNTDDINYNFDIKKYFLISISLIIFISFVFHSHLPILYKEGFGGDRFRHIAAERYLQEGNIYTPSLFGSKENVSMKKIGGLTLPEVLIVGNKQSYSNKWTADIFLSWITNTDVFYIDKYLVYILWSILVPIIFYNISSFFIKKEEFRFLFSLSSLFLSPLIIYGSISQPLSFGLLVFLFVLMFFIDYFNNESNIKIKNTLIFLVTSCLFLYFNYIVFLIIFIILFSFYILTKKINIKIKSIFVFLLSFFILLLDLSSGQTFFKKKAIENFGNNFFSNITNIFSITEFSSKIDEAQRNFVYFKVLNEIEKINMPWIVNLAPFFTILFFILSIIGLIVFYKKEKNNTFLVYLFLTLFLSYILSFLLFDGVRIFAKRVEVFISIMLLLFFSYGVYVLFEKLSTKSFNCYLSILIIFSSIFSTSTLLSGPIMENVTTSDLKAAKWVYDKVKNDKKFCIIGNTWPLLALEYVSNRSIVTGGFDQGMEFSQKERVYVFNQMIKNPSKEILILAKEITGADKCYFLIKNKYIKDALGNEVNVYDVYSNILKIFKSNKDIDDVKIFLE